MNYTPYSWISPFSRMFNPDPEYIKMFNCSDEFPLTKLPLNKPAFSVNIAPLRKHDNYSALKTAVEEQLKHLTLTPPIVCDDNLTHLIVCNDNQSDTMIKDIKLSLNDTIPENTTALTLIVEIGNTLYKIDYEKKDDFLEYEKHSIILNPTEYVTIRLYGIPHSIKLGLTLSSFLDELLFNIISNSVELHYALATVEISLDEGFKKLCQDEHYKQDVDVLLKEILFSLWNVHYKVGEEKEFVTLLAKLCNVLPTSAQWILKDEIVKRYPTILEKALVEWQK